MTTLCSVAQKCLCFFTIPLLLLLSLNTFAAGFDDDDEGLEQDFLFLLEEGYTQEKNEWQFGLSYQNIKYKLNKNQKDGTDDVWEFGIEYGFTDRFQFEFSLPYQKSTWYQGGNGNKENASTLGNPEVDLIYQVLQETDTLPVISMGIGVEIAASNEKAPIRSDEWGYQGFVNASKYIEQWGFFHANLAYGIADKGDEKELSYGVGFVRPFNDNFSGMVEYLIERETEVSSQGSESDTLTQFTLGFSYQNNNGFVTGLAYGQSDNDESLEHAITVKFQYEF